MNLGFAASRFLAPLVWLLVVGLGCSEREPLPADDAGGAAGAAPVLPTLRFEVDDATTDPPTFEMEPEATDELTVVASPPDKYRVRFSILDYTTVAPSDASLKYTDVNTDENGRASNILYAPSRQSTFEVRASIGNLASASLEIRVREKSFGTLEVTPEYDGRRPIDEWFAVAYPSDTCEHLSPPTSLADASCDRVDEPCATGPPGAALRILDIWAGPSYAVTLGAGNYIFGCAKVEQIAARDLTLVTVSVHDRPMILGEEPMLVSLGISETSDVWVQHLNGAIDAAMQSFTGTTSNDLALVLDTMADLVEQREDSETRAGFDQRRIDHDWDYLAVSSLASPDGLLLRNRLRNWMVAGANDLFSDDALIGRIEAVDASKFEFALTEVAGVPAEVAGFETPSSEPTTWTAEADDHLVLGANLTWAPARLVTALGEARALEDYPEQTDLEGALGQLLDCNALADVLINSNELGIYPGCDVKCGAELCTSALGTLAERSRNGALETQSLEVSAAGPAVVDEQARPASFTGTWLGSFPGVELPVVSGTIDGEPTSLPN